MPLPPSSLDRWWTRWGGRAVLIAVTVVALVRAWFMWRHLPGP